MKILLAAEEAAGVQTLKTLAASNHEVVAVLTSSSAQAEAVRGATVAAVATNLGYAVLPAKEVKRSGFAEKVRALEVDILLNVHSLYLIRPEILEAVRIGSFNLHPGPLPFYAGMNAPSWAIFNNEARHGVTLHWMEAGIDTGAIAYQALFDIGPKDTGLTVSTKCVRLGLPLIQNLLEAISNDPAAIPKQQQDFSERHYYGFEVPYDGNLHWDLPAGMLERFVRACDYYPLPSPWGYPLTYLKGEQLHIMKVSLTQEACDAPPGTLIRDETGFKVATADEWLEVERLQMAGKIYKAAEVLRPGQCLSAEA